MNWTKTLRLMAACTMIASAIGCGSKHAPANATVEEAFKNTKPEVKEFADQAITAMEKNDSAVAFVHFRALSLNPDLTQQQRDLATENMLKMSAKLREAAGNGNADAEKVLEMYRATK
jgi:hypothetical protein